MVDYPHTALFQKVAIVLHRPQDAHNIGAVVRAMRNMGMADLRLVQPEPFERATILRVAHHCEALVDRIQIYPTLDEALADASYVIGTAAIQHRARPQTQAVRQAAQVVAQQAHQGKVVLLFGQEDDGLDNAALDRCHLLVTLPTDADYPALNLAQSVLLLLYEVRMALLAAQPIGEGEPPLATQAALTHLLTIGEEVLTRIGFFKVNQRAVMRKVRQMLYKARLTPEEAALVMAILRRLARALPDQRDSS
ncbi:MAG: TrmJ/YjtD family RNA methyltransferase [Caldilineaceae bacterium]|nr:TrmJ/YjtD family RNA methyltransferase [Caldilineaceae bacterium]